MRANLKNLVKYSRTYLKFMLCELLFYVIVLYKFYLFLDFKQIFYIKRKKKTKY